jgi:hypothetical protein
MRIFLILYLLNICLYSDAQIRKDKQVFKAVMNSPGIDVRSISGISIRMYVSSFIHQSHQKKIIRSMFRALKS